MPGIVFCREIDENLIDRNRKLTGNYLEELTENINTKTMFGNIIYLNDSNEWVPFNFSWVEQFFLLAMKCFRVKIDQIYDRNQLHFLNENQVFKVDFKDFKEKPDKKDINYYFMTESNETKEFSKILELKYKKKR